MFLFSQQFNAEAKVPITNYEDHFNPPNTFFSPFGPRTRSKSSAIKKAELDLKQRGISGVVFYKSQSAHIKGKEKVLIIFAPLLYHPNINQDEFWIYLTDKKGSIESTFKYSRHFNTTLVSNRTQQLPLPVCDLSTYNLTAQAKTYNETDVELIEAANVYAKERLNLNIFYEGAQKIIQSEPIYVLTFSDTSATDQPVLFFVDKAKHITSFKEFTPSEFIQK